MIQLTPGLMNVGDGQVIETYQRTTRADNATKEALGLSTTDIIKANIGITSIEEYVTMWVSNVSAGRIAVFSLEQFNQPMRLISVFIDDPDNDVIDLSLIYNPTPDGTVTSRYVFYKDRYNKSQSPIPVADIPLPSNVSIEVTAISPLGQVLVMLKPVSIIANVEGTIRTP
jgi:hypothetical protein